MKMFSSLCLSMLCLMFFSNIAKGQDTKMVGGAAMYPSMDIVENTGNSKDHTTLVAAVVAADLVETLKS